MGEGISGINSDERRQDLEGEHTTQGTDDVLWNCALETDKILLTIVSPIDSIVLFLKGGDRYPKSKCF